MAITTVAFLSTGNLQIEVEGTGPSGSYSVALGNAVRSLVTIMAAQIAQLPEEQKPDEMELQFSLRALSGGNFAITLDRGQGNFQVRLQWGGAPAKSVPGVEDIANLNNP